MAMKFWIVLLFVLSANLLNAQEDIDFTKENFPEAEKELQSAKRAIRRGNMHLEEYNYRQALEEYRKAEGFNADNALLNYNIGLCYFFTNQDSQAKLAFEKAISLNSRAARDIRYYIARCKHLSWDFDEAITLYSAELDSALNQDRSEYTAALDKFISECESGKDLIQSRNHLILVDNLDEPVNSPAHENATAVTRDDSILFFTSGRVEGQGTGNYESIYYARRSGSSWIRVSNLAEPLNSYYTAAVMGISKDDKTMYLYASENQGDIFVSRLSGTEWSEPEPFAFEINSRFAETSLSFTSNEDTLFFTSDRTGTMGEKDIYYSVKQEGAWQSPENIGPVVNSEYDEESVFWYKDTLYFASKGHNSIGGYDLFKSWRKPGGSWNEPENLGIPVNSPYDELFLTASESNMYLASNRQGGIGESDIYTIINLPPPLPAYVRPDSVVRNPVRFYRVATLQFDLKAYQNENAIPALDILAEFLRSEPGVKVKITGYTDTQGDPDYNMWLSKKRAEFAGDYLASKNVPDNAYIVEHRGPGKQVSRNKDDKGRFLWKSLQYNRRVEFTVLNQGNENHLIVQATEIPQEYRIEDQKAPGPVYTIWLLSYKEAVDPEIFNLKDVMEYRSTDGLYDYFHGQYVTLERAERMLQEVKEKYPSAFITISPL